ncbi:MAG: hypothetical protein JNJ73_08435 [Hyphomonadaceae bacterium]|nr:hypothetical protein [Hyphomonadaceae bacterium]
MRSCSLPRPDVPALEAFAASLRLWLLDIARATLGFVKPRSTLGRELALALRRHLCATQYDVKRIVFLIALARMRLRPPRVRATHPQGGYRLRRAHTSALRRLTHGVFKRMRPLDLRRRVARTRDVLENLDAWVARLMARFERGFSSASRVLAAPPLERSFHAPVATPDAADSS